MSEHLSPETTARLLSRQLPPDELLSASRHLTACSECRQQLAAAKGVAISAQFLAPDLHASKRVDDLHLNYEQLEGYVDELLPHAERESVSQHLLACTNCAREVQELTFLRENLATYPQVTPATAAVPQSESLFQRFAGLFAFRRWQLAGLAVMLLLVGLLGLWFWQSRRQAQLARGKLKVPENSNVTPPLIAPTPEQAHQEPRKDENPNGGTVKSAQDEVVAAAIANQKLLPSPALKDLLGKPVTLLGPSDRTQKFELLAPRGIVVESARPTLRWRSLLGAESYQVYVLNAQFDVVQNSEPLSDNSWTVTRPLDRGQTYIWQVVALKDGKQFNSPVAPAREARFKVLDSVSEHAIRRFSQENKDNHLALGIIYAHYGLVDEAERLLSTSVKLNQSTELARKFLQDVKAMRR